MWSQKRNLKLRFIRLKKKAEDFSRWLKLQAVHMNAGEFWVKIKLLNLKVSKLSSLKRQLGETTEGFPAVVFLELTSISFKRLKG